MIQLSDHQGLALKEARGFFGYLTRQVPDLYDLERHLSHAEASSHQPDIHRLFPHVQRDGEYGIAPVVFLQTAYYRPYKQ